MKSEKDHTTDPKQRIDNTSTETIEEARRFIVATASLPDYERDEARAGALSYARLEQWKRFPGPLRTWFRQVVNYLDGDGPDPDHWPEPAPWQVSKPPMTRR